MVFYFRKAKKDTLQRTPAVPLKQEMLFSIYRSDFFPYILSSGWPNFLDMSSCILGPHFNLSTHTMQKHLATILTYRADRPKYVNGFFCILSSPKITNNQKLPTTTARLMAKKTLAGKNLFYWFAPHSNQFFTHMLARRYLAHLWPPILYYPRGARLG